MRARDESNEVSDEAQLVHEVDKSLRDDTSAAVERAEEGEAEEEEADEAEDENEVEDASAALNEIEAVNRPMLE